MGCRGFSGKDVTVFLCDRRPAETHACQSCGRPARESCEFPLGGPKAGTLCGRHICQSCSKVLDTGYGVVKLCPVHARLEESRRKGK